MERAIESDQTPNMFFLHYRLPDLTVQNVFLIPHFAFSLSCVQKRNALSPKAQRRGYVGCYFALDQIPSDARIGIVENGKPSQPSSVRSAYDRLRPLERLKVEQRGWTLDVLQVVTSLRKKEFVLSDVYAHDSELAKLHPNNSHIHDKIRQQLQVLRDMGLLEFLGGGSYRLI
jgi:type II restriction enzyme